MKRLRYRLRERLSNSALAGRLSRRWLCEHGLHKAVETTLLPGYRDAVSQTCSCGARRTWYMGFLSEWGSPT